MKRKHGSFGTFLVPVWKLWFNNADFEKAGYISKSYKLKKDVADRFADACKECGESQASVITRLMEGYILKANQEKT